MGAPSEFDWPYDMQYFTVTKGGRNQTTGAWEPATESVAEITGSFDRILSLGPQGQVGVEGTEHGWQGQDAMGQMRLYTSDNIAIDGRVRIYFDATNTVSRTYRVKRLVQDYLWLEGPVRRNEWVIELEEKDR